jgi:hemolysin D
MSFGTFSRHWTVLKAAWKAESSRPLGTVTGGHTTEFLPAVLEIQQAPPSPIGRAILWTILTVFTTAVLWATFGWIDIVATAQGKIIPSGYSKVIQPVIQQFETGIVRAIHVQDGQVVKQGDLLIELDPTQNRADRDRVTNEYRAALVEAARLRALIAGRSTFDAPEGADLSFVALQQQLLLDQQMEYRARVEAAQHLIDQRRAALAQTQENIRRLEATVPMETQRAEAYKQLLEHQYVSKMDYQ